MILSCQSICKSFGEKVILQDASFHIEEREKAALIGNNGAGKTTTLKSVVGILQFDDGEIFINGTSVKADPIKCKREIAYIPDNPDIYEFMTGIKYLNFVADIFGVSSTDRQEKIRKQFRHSSIAQGQC